ncbi:FtsB family cell division protein [Gardnerella vaginalis]|uniref:FtsB family cell division protein n=1 Tax=Gardnerella vaginalis TaxID=2702 RepID=UPI0039EFC873
MILRNRRMTSNTVDESNQSKKKRLFSGSVVFVSMIVVVFLCCIGLISTIRNYALSLAELHALQRDEAALKDKKQALNNDVERWKDKAYVAAQARERLGFIFPGEQAVRVEHPEAITGYVPESFNKDDSLYEDRKALPWYSDLFYALHKADKPEDMSFKAKENGTNGTSNNANRSNKSKTNHAKSTNKKPNNKSR